MKREFPSLLITLFAILPIHPTCKQMPSADMILTNGKIVTVDQDFTIAEAVAVSNGRILAVGTSSQVSRYAGKKTKKIDLDGKTVIPGLTDSHLHPESASLSEIEEKIPDVRSISQLLGWIKLRADVKAAGEWIILPKFFSTRLDELRQPTLSELDSIAPENPVFLNGSFGGMVNTSAMKLSGITEKTDHPGIIKDKTSGKPTGFIRSSAFGLLNLPPQKQFSYEEKQDALVKMIRRYNRYGITSLFSGAGDYESMKIYRDLAERKILTARICQNILIQPEGQITKESISGMLKGYSEVTGCGDEWLRIGSIKIFLDGGILTGTAYLQEPWGGKAGEIFGINDPSYKGVINYSREELLAIVSAASEHNWSFTAHATGGGSVDLLLDVYNEVNHSIPVHSRRFSIIHGNFFSKTAIKKMSDLGIYANIQPAWFFMDADAMQYILGKERIESFHPIRSMIDAGVMINGGSDHMVKWDADSSVNPYNPFLAIWSMVTRETLHDTVINPGEAISREEALRIYTINNAFASFEEAIKGSIEPGKLADMVILTEDILTCAPDNIKDIEADITILGGEIVYSSIEDK